MRRGTVAAAAAARVGAAAHVALEVRSAEMSTAHLLHTWAFSRTGHSFISAVCAQHVCSDRERACRNPEPTRELLTTKLDAESDP